MYNICNIIEVMWFHPWVGLFLGCLGCFVYLSLRGSTLCFTSCFSSHSHSIYHSIYIYNRFFEGGSPHPPQKKERQPIKDNLLYTDEDLNSDEPPLAVVHSIHLSETVPLNELKGT